MNEHLILCQSELYLSDGHTHYKAIRVVMTALNGSCCFAVCIPIWIFQKSSIENDLWYNRGRRTAEQFHTGCISHNSTVSPIWIFQKSSIKTEVWYNRGRRTAEHTRVLHQPQQCR